MAEEEMLEKELEEKLKQVGEKLKTLPSSVDDLLVMLDEVEDYLSRVEQSPSKSMQYALTPSRKALVASDLLKHVDIDVRVSVASCVSEITRITAPDAPYNDTQMKEIFEIIVESFERLWDISSRSYIKRISILETLGKVRSCVVMLDLECDELILEMFQHFFKVLRSHHPESVFTSMETIMSLVIEESEEVAPELLHPILTSVKKGTPCLPITSKLGETVLENCSSKLKAYLLPAVKSMGMSLSDFSKIVASICVGALDTTKINSDRASGEDMVDGSSHRNTTSDMSPQAPEEMRLESAFPRKIDVPSEKSGKSTGGNGDAQHVTDPEVNDSSKKAEISMPSPPPSPKVAPTKPDSLDPKVVEAETKPDQSPKRKRGRPKVSHEGSAHLPSQRKTHGKGNARSLSEAPIDNSVPLSGPKEEAVAEVPSPPVSQNAPVTVVSPSTNQGLTDKAPRKRGRPVGSKNVKLTPKEAPLVEQVVLDVPPSADVVSERGPKGELDIEVKPNRRAGKGRQLEKENKKSSEATHDLEGKPLEKSSKKVDTRNISQESPAEKIGKGKSNSVTKKVLPEESGKKKTAGTTKAKENSTSKNEKHSTETPRTSKRKRTPAKEISQKPSDEDLGESLVGSKIKVWWPEDKTFYEGIIESFDPTIRKHTVVYVDGDVEILLLKEERWEAIDEFTMQDEGNVPNLSTPRASSALSTRKKGKTDSASTRKKASQMKGTSTSKTKDDSPKSSGKFKGNAPKTDSEQPKDDDKSMTVAKTNDDTSKVRAKAKGAATPKTGKSKAPKPKTGSKSEDAMPQTETKSEDDTSKTRQNSKIATPKTGSKLGANVTSKGRSDASKVRESEEGVKVELLELDEIEENETKSGKKRRRVNA